MGRLFWKIFFAFWLTLIATALATAAVIWALRAGADHEAPLALGPGAALATQRAAAALRRGGVDVLRGWMQSPRRRGAALYVIDEQGADILGRPVPPAALAQARELAEAGEARAAVRLVEAPDGRSYLLFAQLRGDPRRRGTPPAWLWLVVGGAASLAVSAALAWYLARPVRSLRWALRAAGEGRLETRVRPLMKGRRDEIADLGDEFDRMAQQLERLVAAQRRLLHDVSHELRSPLARLQAAAGLARQDPGKLEASLERIEREVARLDRLVGEVLALARLESGVPTGPPEALDLADLVASVAADARFEAKAADRGLVLESAEHVPLRGHAELLHRAIENVMRNAVKYTAEGTSVEVRLSAGPDGAQLAIRDYGPGIASGDAERMFEPFFRGRAGASSEGFGLGLAIAQAAVAAHQGTIRAANAEGGGLRVDIELPYHRPHGQAARR